MDRALDCEKAREREREGGEGGEREERGSERKIKKGSERESKTESGVGRVEREQE